MEDSDGGGGDPSLDEWEDISTLMVTLITASDQHFTVAGLRPLHCKLSWDSYLNLYPGVHIKIFWYTPQAIQTLTNIFSCFFHCVVTITVVTPHCCVDVVTIVKSALFYAAPGVRTEQSDSDKSLVGISSRTESNWWQYTSWAWLA